MIWLVGSLLYGACALVCWRMLTGHLAWLFLENAKVRYPSLHRDQTHPNGEQWFGAGCAALVAIVVWPLMLVLALTPFPIVGAERRAELANREARIKELERELNLR